MAEKFTEPGRLPTKEQALMLRAALLPGSSGREAAIDWITSADFQRLGKATRGILPILYERLRKDGINNPLMPILKGVKKHTWYNNRRLFYYGSEAIQILKQAGIDVMIIKGASMIIDYYHDESLRPMEDLDILVKYFDKRVALYLLSENGWEMTYKDLLTGQFMENGLFEIHKSWGLVHKSGVHLDLHWNLMPYSLGASADDNFWSASGIRQFENLSVKVLSPADQLLHILVHGAPWSYISPIRWIPDAAMVLNHHPELDWNRLIEQAHQRSLTFMVRNALKDMNSYVQGLVPPGVLTTLDQIAPTIFERFEYWLLTSPRRQGIHIKVLFILVDYLRYARGRKLFDIIFLMPRYMKARFGAKDFCQFVSIAIKKIRKQ